MKSKHDFSNKTILVVNTGSLKKRFIFQKLKKLGLKLILLNKEKNWAQPYVDHWILEDTNRHQECLIAIDTFLAENSSISIDGALTFWEDDVLLASKITDHLGLIGIPYDIAQNARNKFRFREFCEKNGIRSPRHLLIRSEEDLNYIRQEFIFPVVMKPVYGSSSAYVVKVETKEDAENVYHYIKNNLNVQAESALHDGFEVFAEEYIEGDEVDVDILLQNGKIKFHSITDNFRTEEPFFVETGESIPSILSEKRQEELFELAEETLEKLGIQNGCIHFEAKSSKNGPTPIEVNLRMGGDEVYSIIKGTWGVDMVENAVKIALGIYVPKMKCLSQPKKFIIGQYFLNDFSGILTKLEVDEKIKRKKYLEDLQLFKKVGEAILVPPEGFEYLGWITVSGETLMDARNNMSDALGYIRFEVARFHPMSSIGKMKRKNQFSAASLNKNALLSKARMEKIRTLSFRNQRSLHVGVAYDHFLQFKDKENSFINIVQKTLQKSGYKVSCFDFNDLPRAVNFIQKHNFDFVFNLCEQINNTSLLEPHAAAILDILQIPYTGSNPYTLSLCIDKIRVKKLLSHHGIPTPKWDYVYTMEDHISADLKYPLIVKPANTDNSFGITNESVVTNSKDLKKQLKIVIEEYQRPALIEEYIDGDEYDICIMGNEDEAEVLPLIRSVFDKMPRDYWHIYTSEMKNGEDEKLMKAIHVERPARIPKRLDQLLSEIALDVYNILDCHDYGKVEIRVDKNGNPYVLELNPNPPIEPEDFFSLSANLAGYSYESFLEEVIHIAIARYKDRPLFYHLQF